MFFLDVTPLQRVTIMPFVPAHTGFAIIVLSIGSLLLPGCFSADSLIQAHRKNAMGAKLGEVDLGKFHISLPQPAQSTAVAEINFHAFGQVANRDLKKVHEVLEQEGPRLRHQLLLATRQLKPEEITDPDLAYLRSKIIEVFNDSIPGEPVESVGFYHFRYTDY